MRTDHSGCIGMKLPVDIGAIIKNNRLHFIHCDEGVMVKQMGILKTAFFYNIRSKKQSVHTDGILK